MENNSKVIEQDMRDCLSTSGFDILHPFSLEDVEKSILRSLSIDESSGKMGYLVGNTRKIWDCFIEWLIQRPDRSEMTDPLDTFVEETIERCVGKSATIFWTRETEQYTVPVQRIAHQADLAYLSAGQFNIHPQFGPWFALRAVVVSSGKEVRKQSIVNPSTRDIEIQASALFNQLLETGGSWQEWLSLRDLYEVGREYRYSDAQIQYHYTRDKKVLFDELQRVK